MTSNLERFKKDLEVLIRKGDELHMAIQADCHHAEFLKALTSNGIETPESFVKGLPDFREAYQSWYSEAEAVVRQVLPNRLSDFVSHYEKPRTRKEISYENYRIEDYLQGLTASIGMQKVVGPEAAISQFRQQLAILKAARGRFESSLYDIRQVAQADLFQSDLDAAEELAKKKFARAAGALAGVVLEKHLAQVCENHQIKITKKRPAISDLNDALKQADAIDVPLWRFTQHLADIRNLCDHSKSSEPTVEQVNDLLAGVRKMIGTVF